MNNQNDDLGTVYGVAFIIFVLFLIYTLYVAASEDDSDEMVGGEI